MVCAGKLIHNNSVRTRPNLANHFAGESIYFSVYNQEGVSQKKNIDLAAVVALGWPA